MREQEEKQPQRMQRGIACGERKGGKDQPGAAQDGTITLQETCYCFGSGRKQKRTLLEFLKPSNKAELLARRHPV